MFSRAWQTKRLDGGCGARRNSNATVAPSATWLHVCWKAVEEQLVGHGDCFVSDEMIVMVCKAGIKVVVLGESLVALRK